MKKQIYLDKFMLRKSFRSNLSKLEEVKLWTKKSKITSCFNIGSRFQMYNGSKFVNLTLERDMQGYTMGEFCFTKRITSAIHNKGSKTDKSKKKK
jgi:ribosomal protein S19